MSKTNETTRAIIDFLFVQGVFAWRQNTTGMYDPAKRRFRASNKQGVSDIIAVVPLAGDNSDAIIKNSRRPYGLFLGIEIKTGNDRLRPEQEGFIANIKRMGGEVILAGSKEDFVKQWADLLSFLQDKQHLTLVKK